MVTRSSDVVDVDPSTQLVRVCAWCVPVARRIELHRLHRCSDGMCPDCQGRFVEECKPCQLQITYPSGNEHILTFASAFTRGLWMIAAAAQPITMRILGLVVAVLMVAAPAAAQTAERPTPDPIYRAGQAAVVAANLADIATTLKGWQSGTQVEANPLIGGNHVGRLLVVKSVTVGAQLLLMHWLAKTGHPTAAGFVGLGSSMPPALAAVHNARLGGAK